MPNTPLVYVADREGDIRELMVRARDLEAPAEGLLRAQHNRALPDGGRLWAKVLSSPPLGEIGFTLPGGRGGAAREVHQGLYAQPVTLSDGQGGASRLTVSSPARSPPQPAPNRSNGACGVTAPLTPRRPPPS